MGRRRADLYRKVTDNYNYGKRGLQDTGYNNYGKLMNAVDGAKEGFTDAMDGIVTAGKGLAYTAGDIVDAFIPGDFIDTERGEHNYLANPFRAVAGALNGGGGVFDAVVGAGMSVFEDGKRNDGDIYKQEAPSFWGDTFSSLGNAGRGIGEAFIGKEHMSERDIKASEGFVANVGAVALIPATFGIGSVALKGGASIIQKIAKKTAKEGVEGVAGSAVKKADNGFDLLGKTVNKADRLEAQKTIGEIFDGKRTVPSKMELQTIADRAGIARRDLEEIIDNNSRGVEGSTLREIISKGSNDIKTKTENLIKKEIETKGIDINNPKQAKILEDNLISHGVKPEEIKAFKEKTNLEKKGILDKDDQLLDLISSNKVEAEAKLTSGFKELRASIIDDLLEKKLVTKSAPDVDGKVTIGLTEEGFKRIPKEHRMQLAMERGVTENVLKRELMTDLGDKIDIDDFSFSPKSIDYNAGKMLLEDYTIFDKIENDIIRRELGENVDINSSLLGMNLLNKKHNFFSGEIKAENIDKAFKKLENYKNEGFLNPSNVNKVPKVNVKKAIGLTEKAFYSLMKNIESPSISPNSIKKTVKDLENKLAIEGDKILKELNLNQAKLEKLNRTLKIKEDQLRNKLNNRNADKLAKEKSRITKQKIKLENKIAKLKISHKNMRDDYRARINEIKASNGEKIDLANIIKSGVKDIVNDLNDEFKLGLKANEIIGKHLTPNKIKNLKGNKVNEIVGKIEADLTSKYINGLKKKIAKELSYKGEAGVGKVSSRTYSLEELVLLNRVKDYYSSRKFLKEDAGELEAILRGIKAVKADGRMAKKLNEEIRNSRTESILSSIDRSQLGEIGGRNDRTKDNGIKEAVQSVFVSMNFTHRKIEDIFGNNEQLKQAFIYDVREGMEKLDLDRQVKTDLEQDLAKILNRNPKASEEVGEFMIATRVLSSGGETTAVGLDILKKDKTSSYFKKTDKYLNEDKPDYLEQISKEQWDSIKGTELAGILLKYGSDDTMKQAVDRLRGYYRDVGERLEETGRIVDDALVTLDPYYIPFSYNKGRIKNFNPDEYHPSRQYVSTGRTKELVDHTKHLKEGDVVIEKDIFSLLGGPTDATLIYNNLRAISKLLNDLMNGPTIKIKNLDENMIKSNIDNLYIDGGNIKVDIVGDLADGNKVKVRTYDMEGKPNDFLSEVDIGELVIKKQHKEGLKHILGPNEIKFLENYLERLAHGGNIPPKSEVEAFVNNLGNHFNTMPLLGNAPVVVKQAGVIFDTMGALGPGRTLKYMNIDSNDLDWAMDNVPGIKQRINAGGGFYYGELKKKNKLFKGKFASFYEAYKNIGMAPISLADRLFYSRTWFASADKVLSESGRIPKGTKVTADILKENVDLFPKISMLADDIAGTGVGQFKPMVYNQVFMKLLFGISSSQLNRWQRFHRAIRSKDVKGIDKLREITFFTVANVFDLAVDHYAKRFLSRHYLDKAMDEKEAEKTFMETLTSYEAVARLTYNQAFIPGKFSSLAEYGTISPFESGVQNMIKQSLSAVQEVFKDEANVDKILKNTLKTTSGGLTGKGTEYLFNAGLKATGHEGAMY